MNARDIIKERLASDGFTGLYSEHGCGCEISDLIPCCDNFAHCKPGYKHIDPRGGNPQAWAIFSKKEPPTDAEWDEVEV